MFELFFCLILDVVEDSFSYSFGEDQEATPPL